MHAQVKIDFMPSFHYSYKHPQVTYEQVLCKAQIGADYDECIENIVDCFLLNGTRLVNDLALFDHLDEFIENPREYLELTY